MINPLTYWEQRALYIQWFVARYEAVCRHEHDIWILTWGAALAWERSL